MTFDLAALPPPVQKALRTATRQTRGTFDPTRPFFAPVFRLLATDLTHVHLGILENLPAFQNLKVLILHDCSRLTSADHLPPSLTVLDLTGCTGLTSVDHLPPSLTVLDLNGCTGLTSVDQLPPSLTMLNLTGCTGLTSVEHLPPSLTILDLTGCTGLTSVEHLPPSLAVLDLTGCTGLDAAAVQKLKASREWEFFLDPEGKML